MAARENQGLQIALMVCSFIIVVLAVTTYFFAKSSSDKGREIASLKTELQNKDSAARSLQDEVNEFKRIMGFAPEENQQAILEAYKKDMESYAVGFDEGERAYRTLVQKLHSTNTEIAKREAASKLREQELKSRIDVLESNKDQQIVQYKQTAEQVARDLENERNKFLADLQREQTTAAQVAKQLETRRSEFVQLISASEEQMKELTSRVNQLDQLNKQKTKLLRDKQEDTYEVPDGRVTWVNQHSRVVWINLGHEDQLKRQTLFSIYPSEENKAATDKKKGSIEVTRILDRHMAEARILDDDYASPILPGDKIHSPVWKNGRRDSYALMGFIDIDGDGKSDRERLRDLIALHGGDIDCELLDDGEVVGKLKVSTSYIILGDPPTAADGNQSSEKLIGNYSRLTGEAQDLGVETMALTKFVDQLGWQPQRRSVLLGRGADPKDFAPKPSEGVQRRSTGNTHDPFKVRRRPPSKY